MAEEEKESKGSIELNAFFSRVDKHSELSKIPDDETNQIKKACKILNITQKELAERIGITPSAISQWGNEIPKTAQVALELMIENDMLKKDLKAIIKGHEVLNKLAVQNLDT